MAGATAFSADCENSYLYSTTNPPTTGSFYETDSNVIVKGTVSNNVLPYPSPVADCEFIMKFWSTPGDVVMKEIQVTCDDQGKYNEDVSPPSGDWTQGTAEVVPFCNGTECNTANPLTFFVMP